MAGVIMQTKRYNNQSQSSLLTFTVALIHLKLPDIHLWLYIVNCASDCNKHWRGVFMSPPGLLLYTSSHRPGFDTTSSTLFDELKEMLDYIWLQLLIWCILPGISVSDWIAYAIHIKTSCRHLFLPWPTGVYRLPYVEWISTWLWQNLVCYCSMCRCLDCT